MAKKKTSKKKSFKKGTTKAKRKDTFTLPTERTEPKTELFHFTQLWHGSEKIGKTTLMSYFEDTFVMFTEPGGKSMRLYSRNITSWSEIRKYIALLTKDKRFQNVGMDTADIMYELALKYACDKLAIDDPQDEGYGKGWRAVRREVTIQLAILQLIDKGLILTSHSKETNIETRSGKKYSRYEPTLSGQARDILEPMVDILAHFRYDGDERLIQIVGDDLVVAGNRVQEESEICPNPHFRYTDGSPIKFIPMGRNGQEAFDNYMAAWENKLKKGGTALTKPTRKKKVKVKRRK